MKRTLLLTIKAVAAGVLLSGVVIGAHAEVVKVRKAEASIETLKHQIDVVRVKLGPLREVIKV